MSEFTRLMGRRFLLHSSGARSNILITLFSIVGMAIGVAALVSVLSVMDGFMSRMRENILSFSGHANVYKLIDGFSDYRATMDTVSSVSGVTGVTPMIFREAMLSTGRDITGIMVSGIDSDSIGDVISLNKYMETGSLDSLSDPAICGIQPEEQKQDAMDRLLGDKKSTAGTVLIGSDIARTLNISLGAHITIVSPTGGGTGRRSYDPKSGRFLVAGIFNSGMYEYDAKTVFMPLKTAQRFFSMGDNINYLAVKTSDMYTVTETSHRILEKLQGFPYSVQNWMELNRITFKFLQTQKIVMFIILGFIILVAGFGIIATLVMLVMRKKEEISILRAAGADSRTIMGIFVFDGLVLGVTGTLLGMILGVIICLTLRQMDFPLAKDVYFFSTLPVEMSPLSFLTVGMSSILISFIATLYPSWQAARLNPVEGLRYD